MTDWQQVNIRVKESTYRTWKRTAEEEYGTMTELVRTSVRREINGQHGSDSSDSSAGSAVETEVAETVDRLENTIKGIDNQLNAVQEAVETSGPEISTEAAIRETLPELPADHDMKTFPNDTIGMSARVVAARLNAKEHEIEAHLQELSEDSPEIGATTEGGKSVYYTKESANNV